MNEVYGIDVIAMRYFNIFGPRQDPNSYAFVIPKFIEILRKGESPRIFGDGLQSRDFTFVDNVLQNLAPWQKKSALDLHA